MGRKRTILCPMAEYRKVYYKAHKTKMLADIKVYYNANKEKILEYHREYYKKKQKLSQKEIKIKLNKINSLKNGNQLFVFCANSRGRGDKIYTLQIALHDGVRGMYSRLSTGVIGSTTTSAWHGKMDTLKKCLAEIGITIDDIII